MFAFVACGSGTGGRGHGDLLLRDAQWSGAQHPGQGHVGLPLHRQGSGQHPAVPAYCQTQDCNLVSAALSPTCL